MGADRKYKDKRIIVFVAFVVGRIYSWYKIRTIDIPRYERPFLAQKTIKQSVQLHRKRETKVGSRTSHKEDQKSKETPTFGNQRHLHCKPNQARTDRTIQQHPRQPKSFCNHGERVRFLATVSRLVSILFFVLEQSSMDVISWWEPVANQGSSY